jgi:hypothetical protein
MEPCEKGAGDRSIVMKEDTSVGDDVSYLDTEL